MVDLSRSRLRTIDEDATQSVTGVTLAPGYIEVEHLLSGVASTYRGPATGPGVPTGDRQPYVTRVLARFPSDPSARSGRVVLEPFNTSNGPDSDVIWSRVSSLLQSAGDAWVGVSVRASSARALKRRDEARYAAVDIPSNDVAWDVLRHVGALLKRGGPDSPLGEEPVDRLYLCGYSQSGADTATFAMAFHPNTRVDDGRPVYDGYLPAAHSGSLTAIASGTVALPRFETAAIGPVDVPVLDLETQCDVEGFRAQLKSGEIHVSAGGATVRRADSDAPEDQFRLYEVAGAPHTNRVEGCDGDGSTFPTSAFLRAALRRLIEWVEAGTAPPTSPRLELATLDVVSAAATDDHGNALGGVRSPFVDLPLSRYEVHSTGGAKCLMAGRETPLPADVLRSLHGDADAYMERFTERLDGTIAAGFLLEEDRAGLLSAQAARAYEVLP